MPFLTNQQSRLLGNRAGIATPVPTYGTELLTDGGMEQWASATDLTQWSETIAGASTINRESTTIHGGTYAARADVDGSNSNAQISTTIAGTAGDWKLLTLWAKASANSKTIRVAYGASQMDFALTTSWQQFCLVHRYTGASHSPLMRALSAASASIFFDDASIKTIALASMFSAKAIPYTDAIIKAKVTIGAPGTRAGIVGWLDSATTPKYFLLAHHDGTTAMLTQCINGTYTSLVSAAATYVAGAYIEIRRTASSNTFKLYYNGSQVGTDQTVSDAGIISNTLAGYSNTYAGNTLSDFSAVAS